MNYAASAMDRLGDTLFTPRMLTIHDHSTDANPAPVPGAHPELDDVTRALGRRSFCTLATTSPADRSHVAGVLYAFSGGSLYVSTMRSSRKARNIVANPRVAVCVPIRRLPVGPPATVQFAATAEVLDLDDPEVVALAGPGRLKAITGHGELELPGGCILRIRPVGAYVTYGIGMSLWRLLRDPLNAAGRVAIASAGR
jgi:Pyridoxamine 5'-phosphate oxidase